MTKLTRRFSLRKTLIAGTIGITVFGLTASPVFAAENFFQRIQRSFGEKMDRLYLQVIPGDKPGKLVIKQMNAATQNLKSFKDDTAVSVEVIGGGKTMGTASLTASGPTVIGELWNPQSYKQEMSVTGEYSIQGTTLSATADVKMVDGVSYMKINQLPAIPGTQLDKLTGTWIKFDPTSQNPTMEKPQFTPEQMQKLQDAFKKMIESADAGTAKPDKKDGHNVFVVTVTVSKPAVVEYVGTVLEVQKEVMAKAAKTEQAKAMIENQDQAAVKKSVEEALNAVGDIKATFWVDKGNYYLRHFELPLEVDVQKLIAQAKAAKGGMADTPTPANVPDTVKINMVANATDFNQQFTIAAPDNAEDAQTFFTKMMSTMAPPTVAPTLPTRSMMRAPTVGTSELPELTPAEKKQLMEYQKRTGGTLPVNY